MLKAFGTYLSSLHRRMFARWIDPDDTFSNVVDLICGKDPLDEAHDEEATHYDGKVLLFQTKAERLAEQLKAECIRTERSQKFARTEALKVGKLVVLSKLDPRLRECCHLYFEHQPVLSEYLVSAVVTANGSLQGLRLVCSALASAFPNLDDDVSIKTVKQMSFESDVDETNRLITDHWTIGGDKIHHRVYDLVLKLQGDLVPEKGVPMNEWAPSGNGAVPISHYRVYGSIFACAYVMVLETEHQKRTTHAA